MKTKLEKDVRFLKIYAAFATLICMVLLLTAFSQNKNKKFEEIDVERINIVEKDGKLKMVLTNNKRTPDILVAGKVLERGEQGGMYFYNDEGDEVGGLVFGGGKNEDGVVSASSGFFFDQYQQDQTLGIVFNEYKGRRRAAFLVQDQPEIPKPEWLEKYKEAQKMKDGPEKKAALEKLSPKLRVYVGKTRDDHASSVLLFDAEGRSRISMTVQPDGQPKLEFLDENGKVIQSFPNVAKKQENK
ncbi:MAG: hypothetical protein ACR2J3_11925 [Aridibacter sp.]